MNLKGLKNKMRQRGSLYMLLLFIVIAIIVNMIDPRYGMSFGMAGLLFLFGELVLAALVGLAVLIVDDLPNNFRNWWKFTVTAWIVLVVASWLVPLQEMILDLIPFA